LLTTGEALGFEMVDRRLAIHLPPIAPDPTVSVLKIQE
jgi:hypothetical protein